MYSFVKGIVDSVSPTDIVVDCGGVGYHMYATRNLINSAIVGQQLKAYTHLSVREDDMSLYAFVDTQEREMFWRLIDVNGVGARSAIGILSNIATIDLAICIMTQDSNALTKIKGVGKKTADRILLELRGKLEANFGNINTHITVGQASANGIYAEAQAALMSLGFKSAEATKMLENATGDSAEQLVTAALMSKGK